MNAIIALCHFCEVHGPRAVFCTQTLRDTKVEELALSNETVTNTTCDACSSIGYSMGMVSQDEESAISFMSTHIPVLTEVTPLLHQAAVRSLRYILN